jgi:CRP-like cAMP-binding protein
MPTPAEFRQLAARVPLFKGIEPTDVAKIFTKGMTMQVEKGNTIFYEGTTGNTMFIVLGGKVALLDGKKHIASLRMGDMFGEMAIITEEPRSATAVAEENTQLFILSEQTFHKLLTKRVAVQLLLNIVGTLSHRLRDSNKKLRKLMESAD